MSKKKFFAIVLCAALFSVSISNVSANTSTKLQPYSYQVETKDATDSIIQSNYKTMLPDQMDSNFISNSGYQYTFTASRTSTGEVELIVNVKEKFGALSGYLEHLATDANGDYFNSEKNGTYLINEKKSYRMILPANAVSKDGFVFLKFSLYLDPFGLVSQMTYKVPVNYEQFKFVDNYISKFDGNFYVNISMMYQYLTVRSYKMPNGDVQLDIQVGDGNCYGIMVQLQSISNDSSIYIPSKNTDYFLSNTVTNRYTIPASQVPTTNKLYFNIYIDLRQEMKLADRAYITV